MGDAHGLYLYILPSGAKSWRWKYRFGGREKKLVLGRYPLMSLKQAREARDTARAKLNEGIDPGAEKAKAKRRAAIGETFEEIARSWHRQKENSLTPRYAKQVLERLERNVFPAIGAMPIGEIEPPDVLAALRRIEQRGATTMAREVRTHVSEVFVWAIASGLARHDPAAIIGKALSPTRSSRRPAVLTIEGARTVLMMTEQVKLAHWSTKLASRLLALTAARPGMVRLAEKAQFQGLDGPEPIWTIPAEKMKLDLGRKGDAAFDFTIPLAPGAVAVVRAAMAAQDRSSLLFPAEAGDRAMSDSTLSKLYREAGFRGIHVPHGWRATFSTIMNKRAAAGGQPGDREVIDLMLAHVQQGVEPIYNRFSYMPRRRELAEAWAQLLLEGAPPLSAIRTGARRKGD